MFPSFMKQAKQLTAAGAFMALTASSVSAGLFCDWCVEPMRPYYSPECEPNWGHYITQWRQFPETGGHCQSGDYCPSCQTNAAEGPQVWTAEQQGLPVQNMYSGQTAPQVFAPPAGQSYNPNAATMQYNAPPLNVPLPTDTYQYQQPQGMSQQQQVPLQMPPLQADGMLSDDAFQMPPAQNAAALGQSGPGNPIPMPNAPQPNGNAAPNPLTPRPITPRQFDPQPQQNMPGQMDMPPLPDQTGLQRYGNRRQAAFNGQTVPMSGQRAGGGRVFNGRLQHGRHGGPIPSYHPQQTAQAQPLVVNQQPNRNGRLGVQGISFSQEVPEGQPVDATPEPAKKSWLRLPRLPSWR